MSALISETTKIDELRLGYSTIRRHEGGWIGEYVRYLSENEDEESGDTVLSFETATLKETLNRVLHPKKYLFDTARLTADEADLPANWRVRDKFGRFSSAAAVFSLDRKPVYETNSRDRFLKHVSEAALSPYAIDHRTLRYAAQTLRPGVTVTVNKSHCQQTGRIKAAAFGEAGAPLAIRLHSDASFGAVAAHSLESDFWINAQAVEIAVHPDNRPNRTLITLHHLRSITAFDA